MGAAGSAGTAMNDMYDESCVMCEYVLEQVDKMIKAQPRLMQGNGYYPGTMDLVGACSKEIVVCTRGPTLRRERIDLAKPLH